MNRRQEMYELLTRMIESAEKQDGQRVLELNRAYDKLMHDVCLNSPTQLDFEYDNCRQSCVLSVTSANMHELFMSDAKEIFAGIPTFKKMSSRQSRTLERRMSDALSDS